MRYRKIPDETIRRLPVYLRGLLYSLDDGCESISSKDLGELIAVNPCQIRKDFSYFGDFGTPGVGYKIDRLAKQISKILKLEKGHKAALVGVGRLGSAVIAYPGFGIYGFEVAAAFDMDPEKIGKKINGITVEDVSNLGSLKKRNIDLGIVAVPRDVTQEITDSLVAAGVKGILNFSPCYIIVPKNVKVITIDIAMDLARLSYYMPAS